MHAPTFVVVSEIYTVPQKRNKKVQMTRNI